MFVQKIEDDTLDFFLHKGRVGMFGAFQNHQIGIDSLDLKSFIQFFTL